MVDGAIVSVVQEYLRALPQSGIHPTKGILFGSFARGDAREYSDIDVVVVAPEFDTDRSFERRRQLWRATLQADHRIEPIACGEEEWETDGSRPILEYARREGVVITA